MSPAPPVVIAMGATRYIRSGIGADRHRGERIFLALRSVNSPRGYKIPAGPAIAITQWRAMSVGSSFSNEMTITPAAAIETIQ
jgi:hypothetical protein